MPKAPGAIHSITGASSSIRMPPLRKGVGHIGMNRAVNGVGPDVSRIIKAQAVARVVKKVAEPDLRLRRTCKVKEAGERQR